jgi:hypothetical protein
MLWCCRTNNLHIGEMMQAIGTILVGRVRSYVEAVLREKFHLTLIQVRRAAEVMTIAQEEEFRSDEYEVCAALLYEAVSRKITPIEEVLRIFREDVHRLVEETVFFGSGDEIDLRRLDPNPSIEAVLHHKMSNRKIAEADHIAEASDSAKRIKLASEIATLEAIARGEFGSWCKEECQSYVVGSLRVARVCESISSTLDRIFFDAYRDANLKLYSHT